MLRLFIGLTLIYLTKKCWSQGLRGVDSIELPIGAADVPHGHGEATHVYKENIAGLLSRRDIIKRRRVLPDHMHSVVFVVRQKNLDELTRILHDVSNPSSSNYGRYLSAQAVTNLTANPESSRAVISYLSLNGASIVSETPDSEYITANATIAVWEKMLLAKFYIFHQTHNSRVEEFVRTEQYWIPKELDSHLECVFNTIQLPHRLFGELESLTPTPIEQFDQNNNTKKFSSSGTVTPATLKSFYNITTQGSVESTQAIYAAIRQYYSPADLKLFQADNNLPNQPVSKNVGNYSSDRMCLADPANCAEGNLDVQYIMSISQLSPTTYWYTDLVFTDWLISVAAIAKPPLVFSISYGAEEPSMSGSEMNAFSAQMVKLSVRGVSVLAASGDDGANSRRARASISGVSDCGYTPIFPASCPYVTTVGATSGPESGLKEVVCQSDKGALITSGGGFSAYYAIPTYQETHVSTYLKTAKSAGLSPKSGYATGRGYPDVSLLGSNYLVRIGADTYTLSGTSASCPVMAGIFSNINAARMGLGRSSIGWANPTLYSISKGYINDITSGNNLCVADGTCCPQGYYATTGWDPATGLGSINYGRLLSIWSLIGNVTISPSMRTTFAPSTVAVSGSAPTTSSSTSSSSSSIDKVIMNFTGLDFVAILAIVCGAFLIIFLCTCLACCYYMRLSKKYKTRLERIERAPLQIDTLRNNSTSNALQIDTLRNNNASNARQQSQSNRPAERTGQPATKVTVVAASAPAQAENIDRWTTAF